MSKGAVSSFTSWHQLSTLIDLFRYTKLGVTISNDEALLEVLGRGDMSMQETEMEKMLQSN